jgi:hypothetical protein
MAATIDELRQYCGLDVDDDPLINANLNRALMSAHELVLGAVGRDIETYLPGDARLTELELIRGEELYTRGATSAKMSNAKQELIFSFEEQLRLELRRAKAEAAT